jgi:hypothetical protein
LRSSFTVIIPIILLGSMFNLYYYINLLFINMISPRKLPIIFSTSPSSMPFLTLTASISLGLAPWLLLILYALTIFY